MHDTQRHEEAYVASNSQVNIPSASRVQILLNVHQHWEKGTHEKDLPQQGKGALVQGHMGK